MRTLPADEPDASSRATCSVGCCHQPPAAPWALRPAAAGPWPL